MDHDLDRIAQSIAALQEEIAAARSEQAFSRGQVEGLTRAINRLEGAFDNFCKEMRTGQEAQDKRIAEVAVTQARHSGFTAAIGVVGGAIAGFGTKYFGGH